MPNQYSPDSRRITYVEDRELFEFLEEMAKKQGITVGELIRRATADKYGFKVDKKTGETTVSARFAKTEEQSGPAPAPKKASAKRKSQPKTPPRSKKNR